MHSVKGVNFSSGSTRCGVPAITIYKCVCPKVNKKCSKTRRVLYCISVEIMVWTRARARALRLALRCVRGQHRSGTKFRSHLRQACPVDDEEFPRMSLKTLASLLMGMSKTRCPHCRLYRTPLQVDGRTTVRSFLRRVGIDRVRLERLVCV